MCQLKPKQHAFMTQGEAQLELSEGSQVRLVLETDGDLVSS